MYLSMSLLLYSVIRIYRDQFAIESSRIMKKSVCDLRRIENVQFITDDYDICAICVCHKLHV